LVILWDDDIISWGKVCFKITLPSLNVFACLLHDHLTSLFVYPYYDYPDVTQSSLMTKSITPPTLRPLIFLMQPYHNLGATLEESERV